MAEEWTIYSVRNRYARSALCLAISLLFSAFILMIAIPVSCIAGAAAGFFTGPASLILQIRKKMDADFRRHVWSVITLKDKK